VARCAAVWVVLAAAAASARAQLGFGASAQITRLEHRVNPGYGLEVSSGVVVGGSATAALGRASLAVTTQSGTLTPSAGPDLDREVAEVGLDAAYRVLEWLSLQGGAHVRAYTVPLGRQRWTTAQLGVAVQVPLAIAGVSAIARAAYKPRVSVSGGARARLALEGSAGLEYARGVFGAALVYSRERYDFAETAEGQRLEQLAGVTMRIGVNLLRRRTKG
jgi:hypothetical protein